MENAWFADLSGEIATGHRSVICASFELLVVHASATIEFWRGQ